MGNLKFTRHFEWFATWGVEIYGSDPPRWRRRVKVGLVTFDWGYWQ